MILILHVIIYFGIRVKACIESVSVNGLTVSMMLLIHYSFVRVTNM